MSKELFYENLEMVRAYSDNMYADHYQALADLCQSPIEVLFLAAFVPFQMDREAAEGFHIRLERYAIVPQFRVGRYRLDFGVFYNPRVRPENNETHDEFSDTIRIAVECDGHAFHEKTKEQAAHDKARDRFLITQGWTVMRFTGSELHADATGCAHQVFEAIEAFQRRQVPA